MLPGSGDACAEGQIMTRKDVRALLKRWGKAKARIETLCAAQKAICDEIDTIDGLHAQNLDGMPHDGTVGQPTERVALDRITLAERYHDRLAEIGRAIEDEERFVNRIEISLIMTSPDEEFILRAHYSGGMTYEAIAENMDIAVQNVKKKELRGVEKIKEYLEGLWKN